MWMGLGKKNIKMGISTYKNCLPMLPGEHINFVFQQCFILSEGEIVKGKGRMRGQKKKF